MSFAAITFDVIDDGIADDFMSAGDLHWLGGCDRPFGRISYGLHVRGELAAVAISASTPNERCGPFGRYEVVELVRLASLPHRRDQTRVALRNWRTIAAEDWSAAYPEHWPVIGHYVSYQDVDRHTGNIYRFDGWRVVAESNGSTGGGTYSRPRKNARKMKVWAWDLATPVCA